MARENQGFQIALIVFVMLTIVLSVTTFLFYRQYDDASTQAEGFLKDAAKAKSAADATKEECAELKAMIGYPREDSLATVVENSAKDREQYKKYEKDDPDKLPSYRKIFDNQEKAKNENTKALTDVQEEYRKLKFDYSSREAASKTQLDAVSKQRDDLKSQLKEANAAYAKDREQFKKDLNEEADKREKSLQDLGSDSAATAQKLKEAEKTIAKLTAENAELRTTVNKASIVKTVQQFTGQIKWVDQKSNTVWIDLGRADGLSRQTNFSVYSADAVDLTKAGKKASIEVLQVQGEHSAEARIVEDKMSDPIIPGDKIYNPVWSRGQRKHFALVGFMDMDGDGKSDNDAVRNLVTLNGGIVDYELNDKGEQRGAMTVNTRYLVKGETTGAVAATDKKYEDFTKSYSKALNDAEKFGIETMPLAELLDRLGWRQPVAVTRAGGGGSVPMATDAPQPSPPASAAKPADTENGALDDDLSSSLDDLLGGGNSKSGASSSSKTGSSSAAKSSSSAASKSSPKAPAKNDSKPKTGKSTGKAKGKGDSSSSGNDSGAGS
jgi:hypothetical protein